MDSITKKDSKIKTQDGNLIGVKGYSLPQEKTKAEGTFQFEGKDYKLNHGSVVIAAITSCANTSNPSVMLGAGN
ncbi:hypothetical protein HCN44_004665 [Aphidius gifuensis]|uniref:Aconitase/3-isopropylmalate dehydratase large subunit alpha/beta/alpha domain-containing protein n=1 Tax=Aphidius gifuensis TaxID=684658 RepID=A0A835CVB1_APHGI|nr:hypothetical protein HCN44_004665 [Aphidius gifuensis]